MLKKILGNAIQCCQCQYGNYIMQYILEKGPKSEKDTLYEVLNRYPTKNSK